MDKYDKAIKYFNDHPSQIRGAWASPGTCEGGALFMYASVSGTRKLGCGCLTQIRGNVNLSAIGPKNMLMRDITDEIRNDDRIPVRSDDVSVDNLYVFAEWQRRLDKEIRN